MLNFSAINNKLKYAVIISFLLHFILIAVLKLNSVYKIQLNKKRTITNNSIVNLDIINPSIVQLYNNKQKNNNLEHDKKVIIHTTKNKNYFIPEKSKEIIQQKKNIKM